MQARKASPVGTLLQQWRSARHLSQLALAMKADVSARHLCFVETGRAQPSREMVLTLAGVLQVPLRERNAMLLAAGFAPVFREASLEAPELAAAKRAVDAIFRQQEPYPAVLMNRHWDVVKVNAAAGRFFAFLLGAERAAQPSNVVRLMFDPKGLRPYVTNWSAVAEGLLRRVQREAVGGVVDDATHRLLDEVLEFPDVPRRWAEPSLDARLLPIVPVTFHKAGKTFDYFSTVTTLGTPQDVTLQELRIECFFPFDAATETQARAL